MFDPEPAKLIKVRRRQLFALCVVALAIALTGCNEAKQGKSEPYYADATPPRKQEFRWSNGKVPKNLDPAHASTPPETDLVRAVYEGLTELDPRTLEARPAVAERWTSSEDFKTWTFNLRSNARWSNGKPVTAEDFVRSWKRLGALAESVAHPELLTNIIGFTVKAHEPIVPSPEAPSNSNAEIFPGATARDENSNSSSITRGPAASPFGVTALDPLTLKVVLVAPDKDLPKLVAHPIFRPVAGDGSEFDPDPLSRAIVTNGAFRVASVDGHGIALDRSETYWNSAAITLERVRFVATANAEEALVAYRAGELDAITNADFEPLALKLLEPFEDFRRRTHAAVNFYEVNHEKPPFDDRRIREALAIAIERERITEGEMEGRTQPALSFLSFNPTSDAKIVQDKEKALELLAEAGFPDGENFPVIRLVVNRNDIQQRIAKAVARMWKENLNIETEVVVKENAQLEEARNSGDFDLVRRGVVFPSADELMSILSILKPPKRETISVAPSTTIESGVEAEDPPTSGNRGESATPVNSPDVTMSETNAVYELWSIPLYFPTSYSLVKPYVSGFEMNSLDAPLLQNVAIDSDWQPK